MPARHGRPPEQWRWVEAVLHQVAPVEGAAPPGGRAELVLLPELCLTGYVSPALDFDVSPFRESRFGPTARRLAGLARAHGVYLLGPLVEADGPRTYNTLLAFSPGGQSVLHYRKRHPWYPETWATPGDEGPPVLPLGALQATCCTCFDVHFVAEECAAQLKAADVLLFPSAWVDEGDERTPLVRGLVERFGLTVLNANWGAGQPALSGQGGSLCAGPGRWEVLAPGGQALVVDVGPKEARLHG